MPVKDTATGLFINKACAKQGSFYDYSKVIYTGHKEKVCIICPKHGEFFQTPSNHLQGSLCPYCARINRGEKISLNTEKFIKKSLEIHGDKYDYSMAVYTRAHSKISIVCKKHGLFYANAYDHMRGCICKKCAIENKKYTADEFVLKSVKVHGIGKYDYSKVDLKDVNTEVCIVCPIHGDFWQLPIVHYTQKCGCPACGRETIDKAQVLSQEEFIKRAKNKHGELYDYSKAVYIRHKDKVKIGCPKHGEFEQKAFIHIKGSGCPKCKTSKGELAVVGWLTKNHVDFIYQYATKGLTGKDNFRFDFYVPAINMFIEFDGEQHYKMVRFFGTPLEVAQKKFKQTQHNDSLKNDYCVEKGISLLRICYKDMDRVPEILNKYVLKG